MVQLKKSLNAWNTSGFNNIFKREVEELSFNELPLQQALQMGSYATKDNIQVIINNMTEQQDCILITSGIFYSSIIAGCSCSDDPTPVDLNSEYCEILFSINKTNAETSITIMT